MQAVFNRAHRCGLSGTAHSCLTDICHNLDNTLFGKVLDRAVRSHYGAIGSHVEGRPRFTKTTVNCEKLARHTLFDAHQEKIIFQKLYMVLVEKTC